jgi:hypothetical protein
MEAVRGVASSQVSTKLSCSLQVYYIKGSLHIAKKGYM